MSENITGATPEPEQIDEESKATFFTFLRVAFREKNETLEVSFKETKRHINVNILAYAFIQAAKTKQLEISWLEDGRTVPEIKLKNTPENQSGYISIGIPKDLYNQVESDFLDLLPLENLAYQDDQEGFVVGVINDLMNGKIPLPENSKSMESYKVLINMLTDFYPIYLNLP